MIETIARVARGEGLRSVAVRAAERVQEGWGHALRRSRGAFASRPTPSLVNVSILEPSPRNGGTPVQLLTRLEEESRMREVALFHGHTVTIGQRAWRTSIEELGAKALVLEGGFGEGGIDAMSLPGHPLLILAIHDFSLLSRPQDVARARAAIFPSNFLRDTYRGVVPELEAYVIEPGVANAPMHGARVRNRVAFVGAVKPIKGGALLPQIMDLSGEAEWHVIGGGDAELLQPLRGRAQVHGYYRAGALTLLLARHGIGLAILPSIAPETVTFSLTLSECWLAGVPVVTFDLGAVGDRIRAQGGGFLVPLDEGAAGIAARVRQWLDGATVAVPDRVPTARDAALAHVALYRELGLLA